MSDVSRNEHPQAASTHFLRRVIDSAFERITPLEPRRTSLFERPSIDMPRIAVGAESAGSEQEEVQARGMRTDPTSNRRERRVVREASPAERGDDEPVAPVERSLQPLVPRRMRAADRDRLTPKPVAIAAEDERVRPSVPEEPPQGRSFPSPARPEQAVARSGEEARLPRAARPVTESGILLVPWRPPQSASENDRRISPPERAHQFREPPFARHRPLHEGFERTVAPPHPEPIINVSIGRIEVRSAVGPAAGSRRPQGSRPMGLNDYLKQRRGEP